MSHRRHLGLRVWRLLVLRPPGCAAGARHPGHTRAGRTASRRRRTGGCLGGVGGLNGVPVSAPVDLPGSNGWRPMAVAEASAYGRQACNGFVYRFEDVAVELRPDGAWSAFVVGHAFGTTPATECAARRDGRSLSRPGRLVRR